MVYKVIFLGSSRPSSLKPWHKDYIGKSIYVLVPDGTPANTKCYLCNKDGEKIRIKGSFKALYWSDVKPIPVAS